MMLLVLKPMIINPELITDLIAVATSPKKLTLINQSGIFCSE